MINKDELNMTRLKTKSITHDKTLTLPFDIFAHLTLLAFVTYSEYFYISFTVDACPIFVSRNDSILVLCMVLYVAIVSPHLSKYENDYHFQFYIIFTS